TGGSDAEQQRDGDWLDHDARYRRTDEYLGIVRRVWTSVEPFDHEGEFYHVKNAYSEVKSPRQPHVPLYFGGASGPAVTAGARHPAHCAVWGGPLAASGERIAEGRAGTPPGREVRFSVSTRPILGATEEKAWERAHDTLARIQSARPNQRPGVSAR